MGKTRIATVWLDGCSGCHMSFLDMDERLLAVADSLRRGSDGLMAEAVDREDLWRAQTPQAFRRGLLESAYAAWNPAETPTDEAVVVRRHGGRIALVAGDARLMKLTYPEDFAMAEALRSGNMGVMDLYRLKNIDSDTNMRRSISDGDATPPTDGDGAK